MSFRHFARLLLLLAIPALAYGPRTIHVPADQPTIQAGINAANAGDTVLVAPGTYNENIDFKGKAITVTSSGGAAITVIKGGVQAATVRFQNGETRSSVLSKLTITGGGDGTVYGGEGGVSILHANPTITDNVITGAGCYGIASVAGAPLIQNNEVSFTHVNAATGACDSANGSGIWIDGTDNTGVPFPAWQGQTAEILHNTIENNTESATLNGDTIGGAGIAVRRGAIPVIENNIIRNNAISPSAQFGGSGGGILVFAAGALIVNNLVYNNSAITAGGGIYIHNFGTDSTIVSLINNTIAGNSTHPYTKGAITLGGEQLTFTGYSTIALQNNVLAGSSSSPMMVCYELPSFVDPSRPLPVVYVANDIYNASGPATAGWDPGIPGFGLTSCNYPLNTYGNISADPLFLNATGADFHLTQSSPAVDTGANSAVTIASADSFPFTTDLDGKPRVVDATHKGTAVIDMGAYELAGLPPTSITASCTPTTIQLGQDSLFGATVNTTVPLSTPGLALQDNGTSIGQIFLSNGTGTFTYSGFGAGLHTLTAVLPSSPTYSGSSASCTINVVGQPTSATLTVTPTSSNFGSPVTLSAKVSSTQTPTTSTPSGSVTFLNGSTPLGTVSLAAGLATLTIPNLPAGTDPLSCTYSGDSAFAPANCNTVSTNIAAASTSLTLTSSANPTPVSSPPLLTIRLNANGRPVPAGTGVNLSIGQGAPLALTTDAAGTTSVTAPSLLPGSYPITATFAGTSNLLPSTAFLTETITGYPTATSLTVTPNPAYQGQAVTLNAAVSAPSTAPALAGPITFYDGAVVLGTAPLSAGGQATLTTTSLSLGAHTLTAAFATAGVFVGSASAPLQETILPSTFAISLTPSNMSIHAGQSGAAGVVLTSVGAFRGPLTLSYGALPPYASAALIPGALTLTPGGNASTTLQLRTAQDPGVATAQTSSPHTPPSSFPRSTVLTWLLAPLALFRFRRQLPRLRNALTALALIAVCHGLSGCGTVGYPFHLVPAGTYKIPVTATDANHNQRSAVLTLTVEP